MTRISTAIADRFRHLTDNQLRIVYSVVVILSLAASAFSVTSLLRSDVIKIGNSDDCIWGVEVVQGREVIVVIRLIEGGQAEKAGVLKGDEVLAINGTALKGGDLGFAQEVLNSAPSGRPIPYVVRRDGRVLTLSIELTRQLPFVQLVVPVVALLWLIIGAMVAFTRPQGRVQQRFFLTGALVIFAFNTPGGLFNGQIVHIIAGFLWLALSTLFFPLWVSFCSIFPVDQNVFRGAGRRIILYSVFIGYVVSTIAMLALQSTVEYDLLVSIQRNVSILLSRIEALYFIVGAWFLYRGYRRLSGGVDRRPMRVILIGTILAGGAFVFITVVQTTTKGLGLFLNPEYLLSLLLLLALPVSFGYAIFNYQLMDFRLVIKTTMVYTATMALIGGLYLAIAYGIGQGLGALTGESIEGTVEVFAFVIFFLLFEPVKRQVQTTIENRFFPKRRDYSEQLTAYSEQASETVGTAAVAELMATTLKNSLDLQGVYVLVERAQGEFKLLAKSTDFPPLEVEYAAIARLNRLLHESHVIISLETVSDPALTQLQQWFSYVAGLYAQGRVIGVVMMTRPRDAESLSARQLQFISGVVAQGAGAIEVARLYDDEIERQRYQEELATARRIQESLLPAEMPKFPGITISAVARTAQAVGGDYYDVIDLGRERFLVIIADVSGKGLPASLYMAEFHGMVHIASAINDSPKAILSLLNEHLTAIIARGSFITATMLLFDTARRTVSMARAGHTPIIRRHGAEVDKLIPAGIALGLGSREIFASTLQEYTVRYESGETFILYSDGVSEAMNATRDEFGEGRLLDVVSSLHELQAEAVCKGIFRHVEEFRAGAEQNDDVTIVVIRVEKEVHEAIQPVRQVGAGAQ